MSRRMTRKTAQTYRTASTPSFKPRCDRLYDSDTDRGTLPSMRLRRLAQTGVFERLTSYFEQRNASMAQILQQQLDSFNPRTVSDTPDRAPLQPPDPSLVVGEFVVEPIPSETPGQEMVYIREGGNEVMVDATAALELIQGLSLPTTNDQVWQSLNQAASDVGAQSAWEQQFVARRRR